MLLSRGFTALLVGFKYCFLESSTRSFALVPWVVGFFAYIATAYAAVKAHPFVVGLFVSDPAGLWELTLYWLAWAGSALLLAASVMILSLVIVFAATSALLGNLAEAILKLEGISKPEKKTGLIEETTRTIGTEAQKLLILAPLSVSVFVMALIPVLAPLSIFIAAWTLAFEAIDPTLELFSIRFKDRLSFAKANWGVLVIYGLSLAAIGLIPFAGILLPPIAVAGGTWLLIPSENSLKLMAKKDGSTGDS